MLRVEGVWTGAVEFKVTGAWATPANKTLVMLRRSIGGIRQAIHPLSWRSDIVLRAQNSFLRPRNLLVWPEHNIGMRGPRLNVRLDTYGLWLSPQVRRRSQGHALLRHNRLP